MERTLIDQLHEKNGNEVQLYGSVSKVRDLGKVAFLVFRDRKGVTQVVIEKNKIRKTPVVGSFLKLEGIVNHDSKSSHTCCDHWVPKNIS